MHSKFATDWARSCSAASRAIKEVGADNLARCSLEEVLDPALCVSWWLLDTRRAVTPAPSGRVNVSLLALPSPTFFHLGSGEIIAFTRITRRKRDVGSPVIERYCPQGYETTSAPAEQLHRTRALKPRFTHDIACVVNRADGNVERTPFCRDFRKKLVK